MSAASMLRKLTELEVRVLELCQTPRTIGQLDRHCRPLPTAQTATFLMQQGFLANPVNEAGTVIVNRLELTEKGERLLERYTSGELKAKDNPESHAKIPDKQLPPIGVSGNLDGEDIGEDDDEPVAAKPTKRGGRKAKAETATA